MNKFKNISLTMIMGSLLSISSLSHAQIINGQNINPFTGKPTPLGHVEVPEGSFSKVPDQLNFEKINLKRDCSPAELLSGKTECNRCDLDTPNVVKPYSPNLAAEMAKNGGVFIYGETAANMYQSSNVVKDGYTGLYLNAFDYRPYTGQKPSNINTTPKRTQICNSDKNNCHIEKPYILYRGYNLQGTNKDFAPLNNRSVCELLKPQGNNPNDPNDNDGDKNKFNGAKILGLAGLSLSLGNVGANWMNHSLFNLKGAMGKQNNVANTIGKAGASVGFTATEMFACLEYYTGTNPSMCGGDHVSGNTEGKAHFCKQPMNLYYNTKINEIYCKWGACDGQDDGAFKPGTIPLRMGVMMTNPFYIIGNTAIETQKIVMNRPMSCPNI